MRQLPAPGQAADFLPTFGGPGVYHRVRLAGGTILACLGAWGMLAARSVDDPLAVAGVVLAALVAFSSAGYLAGTLLPFSRHPLRLRLRAFAMWGDRVLLRTLLRAARLVGDKTDPILRSFVQANNAAVRALYRRRKPENVLVLLPHCVVYTRCPKKVVKDLARCTECDLCQMEEILGVSNRAQLPVRIAIRSADAYAQAREMGPDLTLAVACDDRLVKGITRVPEIPAFGLPLHLPVKDACYNNLVDTPGLRQAMAYFLGPECVEASSEERVPSPAAQPPGSTGGGLTRLPALPSPGARSGARSVPSL